MSSAWKCPFCDSQRKGSTLRAEISEVEEQRQKFGLCRAELLPFPALLGSGFGATALAARGTKGSVWTNGSAPESDMCPLCSLTALQLTRERLLNAFPARAQPLPVFTQPCAPWQLPGIHCPSHPRAAPAAAAACAGTADRLALCVSVCLAHGAHGETRFHYSSFFFPGRSRVAGRGGCRRTRLKWLRGARDRAVPQPRLLPHPFPQSPAAPPGGFCPPSCGINQGWAGDKGHGEKGREGLGTTPAPPAGRHPVLPMWSY